MAVGANNKICFSLIFIVAVLPTVSSYCFKLFKKKDTGEYDYRCNTRVNDIPGGNLTYCCSLNGSIGFTNNRKGKYCEICEAALALEDLPPLWSEWGEWSVCSRTCEEGIRLKTRQCVRGECEGPTTEQTTCILHQHCPVDGNWGRWTDWLTCSKTCSVGIRTRTRNCDDPAPQYNGRTCLAIGGDSVEQENCVEVEDCQIDGHWGNWQPYSACSATCGVDAIRMRDRACDSPPAQFGGLPCSGNAEETQNCQLSFCPIDGKWGDWSPWTGCSKTCDDGKSVRKRSCNNPKPQYNGKPCNGDDTERDTCNLGKCIGVADWTQWLSWSPCSDCSMYNQQIRRRTCDIKKDTLVIKCDGSSVEYHKCTSELNCKADEEIGSGSSGDGCVGDDTDGCPDEQSSSVSFSTSDDKQTEPLPTRCRPVVNMLAGDGNSPGPSVSISSDSVSDGEISVSEGGKDEEEDGFRWVDCPEVEPTPTPPDDDCKDSNVDDCAFSDYYDDSAPPVDSVSDYGDITSEPAAPSSISSSVEDGDGDGDYESSLKDNGGGGGGSFSSS